MQVLHDSPGRLRLALPALMGSKAQAAVCEEAVRSLPGVRLVQANPLTGNLLVIYTPAAPTREKLQEVCSVWAREPVGDVCPHGRQHGGHRKAHAGATALVAELVPHLLPLLFGSCPICRR